MNDSNYQDMELEVLNNQNIEPELEVLVAYNSIDDLSDIDIDNFDDIEGSSVGKTFKNWDQVVDFMKKYAIIKDHRIRISGGEDDAGMLLKRLNEKKIEDPQWFEKLLQDYPQSSDYLIRSLGCCTKSWARAFSSRYFTAGVQSTSRNEGENSTLKHLFGSSSLSLCELFEALEERYQEETDYCKFVSWKQMIPQIGPKNGAKAIFEPVIRQLNEFVMPNIMKKQKKQMNLSFYYHAVKIDLEAVFFKERSYGYLCRYFYHIMTLTPNARFHIGLVNRRWYKDILQETDITNNEFIVISSDICISTSKAYILPTQFLRSEFDVNGAEEFANCGSNQSPDEISKAISKKHKFSELWGLGKKIMVNAIEDSNEDIYYELLGVFTSIQNRTSLQRVISGVSDVGNFSHKINNNSCMISIRNPVKKRSKGRPKSKRIANAFEKSDTKTSYKCKICNKQGHNSKTCKKKGKSNINTNNANDEIE
ncbi:19605_t:CDS:2, partial [Cetraspora pellucida]